MKVNENEGRSLILQTAQFYKHACQTGSTTAVTLLKPGTLAQTSPKLSKLS